jgi:uncharacterized phage protein gp47/JayE
MRKRLPKAMEARSPEDEEFAARVRYHYLMCKLEDYAQAAFEAFFDYVERQQGLRREAAEAADLEAAFDDHQRSIRQDTARDVQLAHLSAMRLEEERKMDWAKEMMRELTRMFDEGSRLQSRQIIQI